MVSLTQRVRARRDAFAGRSVYRNRVPQYQEIEYRLYPADMVGVVMGAKYRGEREIICGEVV